MGLAAASLKHLILCKRKYGLKGPVMTLGNQDIYATANDMRRWLKDYGVSYKEPKTIHLTTSRDIPSIHPEGGAFIHAKTFFEFLGIPTKAYFDIDKFDFDKPAILHDLQRPIPKKYHAFFNLIVDSGTLEHIFDIRSVMENIVRMTKVGGYVWLLHPSQNFLNHGFYQLSPTFYHDFFTANGFEVVEAHIVEIRGSFYRFHEYEQLRDYRTGLFFFPGRRLSSSFLVRKRRQVNDITIPDQYYYSALAKERESFDADSKASTFDSIIKWGQSVIPFRYQGHFFGAWSLLKSFMNKGRHFDLHN